MNSAKLKTQFQLFVSPLASAWLTQGMDVPWVVGWLFGIGFVMALSLLWHWVENLLDAITEVRVVNIKQVVLNEES